MIIAPVSVELLADAFVSPCLIGHKVGFAVGLRNEGLAKRFRGHVRISTETREGPARDAAELWAARRRLKRVAISGAMLSVRNNISKREFISPNLFSLQLVARPKSWSHLEHRTLARD